MKIARASSMSWRTWWDPSELLMGQLKPIEVLSETKFALP